MVKTEKCAFSEYPIFPGHGTKYVRKDGQPLIFGSSKAKSLYLQRLKPSKLMWTQVGSRPLVFRRLSFHANNLCLHAAAP